MLFGLGLIVFLGTHLFTAIARGPRAAIQRRIGEGPYKGLYSLLSLAGLILIYQGWDSAPQAILYQTPYWMRHVTYLLVWAAFVLVVAPYMPAGKIAGWTKHPMLLAVKVWATAHLLVNGDVRSVVLFGSFLAWAVIARIMAKKRGDTGRPAGPVLNDLLPLFIGSGAYVAVLFWLHPYIAGVALVG